MNGLMGCVFAKETKMCINYLGRNYFNVDLVIAKRLEIK